jgi:endonuclease YncB( thermonuclease family)
MPSTCWFYLAAFILTLLLSPTAFAETLTGKVVKVTDGDTVQVLDASKRLYKIRLSGIDAPETGQAYGRKAKAYLLQLVARKRVQVEWNKRDRYKRIVGKIIHDGRDVNLAMVRAGLAWWYRKYAREQSPADRRLYEAAEDRARADRVGLWADPKRMAPWDWRKRPPPAEGYAARCPCGSGRVCTGKRGGRFCVRESGSKRYYPR